MEYKKIFEEHGVHFAGQSGNQHYGNCPFCSKDKFYANPDTGGWDCKVCLKKGFVSNFLRFTAEAAASVSDEHWRELEEDRGIDRATLKRWGVGWDGRRFIIPVRDAAGAYVDLRMYVPGRKTRSTAGATSGLIGSEKMKANPALPVYVCEGEWDAMAMDMLLQKLGKKAVVVGVPGAAVFKKDWAPLFQDRDVSTFYDNDEAGENAERLIWERLGQGNAKHIRFIHWPTDAPIGFDLRDWVKHGVNQLNKPDKCFAALFKMLLPHPRKRTPEEKAKPKPEDEFIPEEGVCGPEEAIELYKKWLHLDNLFTLTVMFGACFANRLEGEPIWLFLVDPPGGGKSELLMSLSEHASVYATTSLTPHTLISGATFSNGKDPSLIPLLDRKMLIIKDFTTIISMHYTQSQEICGTLRDAYDGQTARNFGTGVRRAYKSKFGILAGVTDKIETFSSLNASLGERFLRWRMHEEDRHTEEEKILRALSNISSRIQMQKELRSAANRTLNREMPETPPTISPAIQLKVVKLAQFTSMLRGTVDRDRYRDTVQFRPVYEIGTRLAMQLCKIGMGMAIFWERDVVGEEDYACLRKLALDTAPDRLQIVIQRMWERPRPLRTQEISEYTGLPQATIFRILQDMELLGVVGKTSDGMKHMWWLSPKIKALIADGGIYAPVPPESVAPSRGAGAPPPLLKPVTSPAHTPSRGALKIRTMPQQTPPKQGSPLRVLSIGTKPGSRP